jgi:hypothetical protein
MKVIISEYPAEDSKKMNNNSISQRYDLILSQMHSMIITVLLF